MSTTEEHNERVAASTPFAAQTPGQPLQAPVQSVQPQQPFQAQQPVQTVQAQQPMQIQHDEHVRTTSARGFTPDAMIAGLVGLIALIVGLIVLVRAGLHAPLSQPVVTVLGFTHTATLGLIEVGLGLFLVIAAASRSRSAEAFGGLAMVVGGVVGVVQYSSFNETLALERGWAWMVVIAGGIVAAAALLLPRMARRSTTVRHSVD
jgi:hypothetical protein